VFGDRIEGWVPPIDGSDVEGVAVCQETQHLGEVDDAGSVQDVVALQKRIDGDELPVVIDAQRVDHIEAGEISGQLRAAVERRVGSPRQRDDVGDI
jgi:hypothetical protein